MLTTTEMMTPAKTPLSEMLNVLTLEDRRPGGQDDSLTSASVLALCLVEDGVAPLRVQPPAARRVPHQLQLAEVTQLGQQRGLQLLEWRKYFGAKKNIFQKVLASIPGRG